MPIKIPRAGWHYSKMVNIAGETSAAKYAATRVKVIDQKSHRLALSETTSLLVNRPHIFIINPHCELRAEAMA